MILRDMLLSDLYDVIVHPEQQFQWTLLLFTSIPLHGLPPGLYTTIADDYGRPVMLLWLEPDGQFHVLPDYLRAKRHAFRLRSIVKSWLRQNARGSVWAIPEPGLPSAVRMLKIAGFKPTSDGRWVCPS